MIKARQFALKLNLGMKIGDVEFQADKSRATFYYIADGRVDFRELIKLLAQEFKVKIEMKQIGARQEAGRIGGIGSCGRELCCSTWRTELPSVPKSAADRQNLNSNADKLLGQCGKLKCCLMYELDTYIEANKDFPSEVLEIETKLGTIVPIKIDILHKIVWYTDLSKKDNSSIPITLDRVKEIIMLNKKGVKVDSLVELP
jgi:cell fate regulator YaaT (PSP1 superfamily)